MAHDHVVENNPRRETLLALVGILMFAAMVVLIVLSAWLRPVAPDTQAMIAQREAAAAPAPAAAPEAAPAATAAAPATTPAADSTAATLTTAPAADLATAVPASAAGTDNAVTGGETQAQKVAEAGPSTVKTTN